MSARLLRELAVADGPVVVACRVLGISRSRFYEAADRAPSVRPVADQEFTATIASIHTQSRGTCRAPRVHAGVLARAAPSDRGPEQLPMLPPRHRRTPWGAHRRTTRVLRSTTLPRSHSNSSRSRCCDDQLNPPSHHDLQHLSVLRRSLEFALHRNPLSRPSTETVPSKPGPGSGAPDKAIAYGNYDVSANTGWVSVGSGSAPTRRRHRLRRRW